MPSEIVRRAAAAFRSDRETTPRISLRGGYAADSYEVVPPYDPALDQPTDAYLETYTFWGLAHLDPASWRHYLPQLIDYAVRHPDDPRMAVEGLLHNLRPPDREPPRLGSLDPEQEAVIVDFLEALAFADDSPLAEFAMQILDEWWLPGARYRPGPGT